MARLYLLLALLLQEPTAHAEEQAFSPAKAQQILQDMRTKLAKVQTITANIDQRRVLALFSDELRSKAKLFVKMPNKIRWETTVPYPSLLIFNDHNTAKFEQKDAGWKKIAFGGSDILSGVMAQIMKWNQGDFTSSGEAYSLQVFKGPRIELVPRSDAQKKMLSKIELHPDPASLRVRRTILREPKGDYIDIVFSDYNENAALADALFDLEKPQ